MSNYKIIINPFAELDILDDRDWYNYQKDIRRALVNRFPYIIFFTVYEPVVNIFALFHTSRNPKVWKSRK